MAEKTSPGKSSVEFLIKAMSTRAPGKRRVKPVEKHLMTLDFAGLGDSSDDSDYEVPTERKDIASDESEELSSLGSESGSNDNSDSDDSTRESQDDDDDESEDEDDKEISFKKDEINRENQSSKTLEDYDNDKNVKVLICTVCLGDMCESNFDVMTCDSCNVTVHEGCYGMNDAQSVHSTDSTSSTEPWFCDLCRAGVVYPPCELCPNFGGVYKETDQGRWVHLVCALYTPGVAFDHPDQLSNVTLYEMPYSKWGAKICSLCDDSRFSNTGVCITCDAGMCRNNFHVTCAQKQGLLSEASDVDIADPFFAYCKQHVNRTASRIKRKNFLALQAGQKHTNKLLPIRIEQKLSEQRELYEKEKTKKPDCWVFKEKTPRLLQSSAASMRALTKKAQLMGIDTDAFIPIPSMAEIGKKWNLPPAFTPDFAMYYVDRNSRIDGMKNNMKTLIKEQEKLQTEAKLLRFNYDQALGDVEQMQRLCADLREQGQSLYKTINLLSKHKFPIPDIFLKPKQQARCTRRRTVSTEASPVINKCGICHKTTNQHLLAHCDKCHQHCHLGCLDPPLTRMPKKTKSCGWACSLCDPDSDKDASTEEEVDADAPRKLRQKRSFNKPVLFQSPPTQPTTAKRKVLSKYSSFKRAQNTRTTSRDRRLSSEVKVEITALAPPNTSSNISPVVKCPRVKSPIKLLPKRNPPKKKPSTTNATPVPRRKAVIPSINISETITKRKNIEQNLKVAPPRRASAREINVLPVDLTENDTSDSEISFDKDIMVVEIDDNDKAKIRKVEVTDFPQSNRRKLASKLRRGSTTEGSSKKKSHVEVTVSCKECKNQGTSKNTVKCDECLNFYHFSCLDPPVKKSPKTFGYSWFCSDCDPVSNNDSADNNSVVMEGCDETPMLFDMTNQMIEEYEQSLADQSQTATQNQQNWCQNDGPEESGQISAPIEIYDSD